MEYKPLTPEQFQKAIDAGFSPERITEMEKQRKLSLSKEQPIKKEQTPGFLGKVSRFLGTEELGIGLGKALLPFTKEGKMTEEMLSKGQITPKQYEEITTGGITPKEVAGSALQTAATFIPGVSKGANLTKKVVSGAGTGYVFDVASKLRANETINEVATPGIGTLVGAVLPIVAYKIAGLGKPSELAKKGSTKLEELSLRMTPVDKQNMIRKGENIAKYLSEKKIVGNPEVRFGKVNELYTGMEKKVQEIIKGSGAKFKKVDLLNEISQIPELYKDNLSEYPSIVAKVERIMESLQKNYGDEISAEIVNKIKRAEYDNAYAKNATDVINEISHDVGDIMKSKLDTTISGLQKLNEEYGTIINARKILYKAMTRPQLGLVGKGVSAGVGGVLGGTLGGGVGSAVGLMAGERLGETVAGTATRSAVGAGLQNLSTLLDKIPTDKAGNLQLTKKAFLDLLTSIGK